VTAFEQLLPDRLRVLGPDHPDTLSTRHELAGWKGEAGDAGGAVAALEQVLLDRLRVLGPDQPYTLITRAKLAHWRGPTRLVGVVLPLMTSFGVRVLRMVELDGGLRIAQRRLPPNLGRRAVTRPADRPRRAFAVQKETTPGRARGQHTEIVGVIAYGAK
jgi:hypothetical protein